VLGILERELPAFAAFLLAYEIPAACRGSSRYGIVSYHEKSLLETAEQSSRTASFHEIVEDWAVGYFTDKPKEEQWEGTAWQWIKHLHQSDVTLASALRSLTAESVSRQFMALKAKGADIDSKSSRTSRVWIIKRPKHLFKKA
jgi:hypothetical protein